MLRLTTLGFVHTQHALEKSRDEAGRERVEFAKRLDKQRHEADKRIAAVKAIAAKAEAGLQKQLAETS